MKKVKKILFLVFLMSMIATTGAFAAKKEVIVPNAYPGISAEELGQLRWVMQIAGQDLNNFTSFQQVDDQGVITCRYTIAFALYFQALSILTAPKRNSAV